MSETEPHKLRQLLAQAKPLLLPLAALSGALALWLAWSGWQQMQDGTRRAALKQSRDTAVQLTHTTLSNDLKRLAERLDSGPVQAALQAGDLATAGKHLGADWPGLEESAILPVDLSAAYAELPKSGFGRIAVAEAALAGNKTEAWVVREGGGARLALAAPARHAGTLVGVAYVRLPLARATVGLDNVSLADDTYLALRQGGFTLLERGDLAHSEGAERMAVAIPDSGLRVAAAVPNPATRISGLGRYRFADRRGPARAGGIRAVPPVAQGLRRGQRRRSDRTDPGAGDDR